MKLSLITINYNGLQETLAFLESLYSTIRSCTFEVIVVDNGSKDAGELEQIKERFPEIIPIRSDENLGFAGGNNLGLKIAQGEYIMLLNNDILLCGDSFEQLFQRFESDPSIGAISPKLLYCNIPAVIQFAGYTPLSYITMRNRAIGFNEIDSGQFQIAKEIPYCHGAAMMIKRETFQKVGPMPDIFFLYYEEIDWSTTISRAGYKLFYEPACTMIHKESCSVGKDSPLKSYYLTRNRLLYAYRNFSSPRRELSIIYQVMIALPKTFFINIVNRKRLNAKAAIKGCSDFFRIHNKRR